jgi:hypothetical protein
MSKMVWLDCRVFVSGADLSGWGNKIEASEKWEDKKTTNWRSGKAVERIAGLGDVDMSGAGQWEAGSAGMPDDTFWGNRRVIEPWTVAPDGTSDLSAGTLVYLTQALRTSMKLLDAVGEVAPWEAAAQGSWPLVRGLSMHPSGTARTATGNGATVDFLAGPAAGQAVYANLHVLSVAAGGGTLTVAVQSSTASNFASPTTRGTFTAATAVGGQPMKITNPGTDRYWRVTYTISGGTSPSFLFLSSLGFE